MKEIGINEYRYILKTPVHVGSGEKLGQIDFTLSRNQCIVIDIDSLLQKLKDNSQALYEFSNENIRLDNFLTKYEISPSQIQKYTIDNPDKIRPRDILENIKTGMGRPLLPGSSIKGAIRTILLWYLIKTSNDKTISGLIKSIINSSVKKEHADSKIDNYFFGSDPNHDFLRGLQVGDVEFKVADMKLVETKVLNLKDSNSFGWKKMGRQGFTNPDHKKATPIFCETIREGATSDGRLKIDDFLFENFLCAEELGFSDKKELLASLPDKCNEFSRAFIDSEIKFFDNCKMQEMVKFYSNLRNEMPRDNKAFLLHLGWGTGWKSMTGNWLNDEVLEKLRKRFLLGKFMLPVFPKSRKIAFIRGLPLLPFGWIQVERLHANEADAKTAEKSKQTVEVSKSEFIKNFDEFRLRPSPENFRAFIENIKPEQISELKELSFKTVKDSINIGFVTPLLESNIPEDIKKILARKLLEIITMGKKWSKNKVEKYHQLENIAF